jgi:gamma-glutamylcyclotransferase (GGCT)/AIG2-like uncharacterized protein YtfP
MSDAVFVYGTLQDSRVLKQVTGRAFAPVTATLAGYARYLVKGEDYPGIIAETGATVEGLLLRGIDSRSLQQLDRYEGALYRRRQVGVEVTSGFDQGQTRKAWVYVVPVRNSARLSANPWDLETYSKKINTSN